MFQARVHRIMVAFAILAAGGCDPSSDVESGDEARSGTNPYVVPLVGRRVGGNIKIYEPYEVGFHNSSDATSIPGITGLWVLRLATPDTPDLWEVLEYLNPSSATQLQLQLTWVGLETVSASSGGSSWSTAAFPATGTRIGTVLTSGGGHGRQLPGVAGSGRAGGR
jgi:hypothetical protein